MDKKTERLKSVPVMKWYKSMKGQTRFTTLRVLYSFLEHSFVEYPNGIAPEQLLELRDHDYSKDHQKIFELMNEFVSDMEEKRGNGGYIYKRISVVRSFLRFNGIIVSRKIKVSGLHHKTTLVNEEIPSVEMVRAAIFGKGKKVHRICVMFMAWTGVRPEVLGNWRGDDGLEVRDIQGLEIKDNEVYFERVPAIVNVRVELDKNQRGYHTFLPSEGCIMLKHYLEERLAQGEEMGPQSPIRMHRHVTSKSVRAGVSKVLHMNGIRERPYVLRRYWETQLGAFTQIKQLTRDYIGGHTPTMSNSYITGKGKIHQVLEAMWREFRDVEEYLQGTTSLPTKIETEKEILSLRSENEQLMERVKELENRTELVSVFKDEKEFRKMIEPILQNIQNPRRYKRSPKKI